MKRLALLLICTLGITPAAYAAVTVQEHALQKGLFVKADCNIDPSDPSYDECHCDADVRYPEIVGMANNAIEMSLNTSFKHTAEQAQCEGKQVDAAQAAVKDEKHSPSSVSHHYDITFQSPTLLGLKFTDWAYTGGAHGNGSVDGVIVDLTKGTILGPTDLFSPQDMAKVNDVIYDTLSAKPEGEVFRDQIESRKGAFIGADGCQGCTLTLSPDGIKVVFQTYEVASFAEGNMEVPIPAKYVTYPAVAALLATPTTTPEKK